MTRITESLESINDELIALSAQIETGEPLPPTRSLRSRIGSTIKNRLYRYLWWQSHQIKALTNLMSRYGREEVSAMEGLSTSIESVNRQLRELEEKLSAPPDERIRRLSQQLQEAHRMILECRQQLRNSEGRFQEIERELNSAKSAVSATEARIIEHVQQENGASAQRSADLTQQINELAQRLEAETTQRERERDRLSELGLLTHQTRTALSIQERRLALFFEEVRKRLPEPAMNGQLEGMIQQHAAHKYDSLYVAFEDIFRGSREDIKNRQSVYLPFLKDFGVGSSAMPIVDLGCGRGEWLELLREHDLLASGIDNNEMMVDCCKSMGLEVVQADALSHLKSLPENSVGALTSFHMVEHLPFDSVLALIDDALRALKPGGILILETPNPGNLLVGAHTFYLDPTHIKPLPSPMLRFFVEARGFCDVRVLELSPFPKTAQLPDDSREITKRLNEYLYGAQDYSVIGKKP